MKIIEDFKKDINNSLKKNTENTGKQEKPLKRKHIDLIKRYKKKNLKSNR